jgi:hypothetical protein
MSRVLLGTLLLVGAVVTTNVGIAQNVGPTNPPLIIRSVDGKDSFEFYCAGCHGRDGRGDGPVADRLRRSRPICGCSRSATAESFHATASWNS